MRNKEAFDALMENYRKTVGEFVGGGTLRNFELGSAEFNGMVRVAALYEGVSEMDIRCEAMEAYVDEWRREHPERA